MTRPLFNSRQEHLLLEPMYRLSDAVPLLRACNQEWTELRARIVHHYANEMDLLNREQRDLEKRRMLCGVLYGFQWAGCFVLGMGLFALSDDGDQWVFGWLALPVVFAAIVLGGRHSHHAEMGLGGYRPFQCWQEKLDEKRELLLRELAVQLRASDAPRAADHFPA